jgi:hypothetical protein
MAFDRFDICAAYNLYATLWAGGGRTYAGQITARLARFGYRPSRGEEYLCGLSPEAREIYAGVVSRHHGTGYVHCACCGLDTMGSAGVALCSYCEDAGCEPWCGDCPACRGRSCQCPGTRSGGGLRECVGPCE